MKVLRKEGDGMKIIKAIFIFILIIFAVVIFLELIPAAPKYDGDNPWIIKKGDRPFIIPHGGAKELYPESTVYAYRKLSEAGYNVFEVDLALTKDEHLISHHDVNLKRLTGYEDLIKDLTYEEIRTKFTESDFAENYRNFNNECIENIEQVKDEIVPATLEYLFKNYSSMMYVLEIKDTEENSGADTFKKAVDKLLELIEEYDMEDNVIVSSTDDKITQLIRKETEGKIMTSTATNETLKFVLYSFLRIDFFYKPKDGALLIPIKDDLTDSQRKLVEKVPNFIRKQITTYDKKTNTYYTDLKKQYIINDAHRHNMAVHFWTVNDKEEMKNLIKMGVDGIITDRPDLLLEVYEELGL